MGLTIDFIMEILRFIGVVFVGTMFFVGLGVTLDYLSDSYDASPELQTVYYDICMSSCVELNKEHLYTRYLDSGDECYCMENNESIRIW